MIIAGILADIILVVGRAADFTAVVEALIATRGRVISGFSINVSCRVIKEEQERRKENKLVVVVDGVEVVLVEVVVVVVASR